MSVLLPKIFPRSEPERLASEERELIRKEAEIGGRLFGPIPQGRKRSFFCLDQYTWIWHEEWQENGRQRAVTTRYDVRPDGVIKSQDGQKRQQLLSQNEARNLYHAVRLYQQQVAAEYEHMLQMQTA